MNNFLVGFLICSVIAMIFSMFIMSIVFKMYVTTILLILPTIKICVDIGDIIERAYKNE